MSFGDDAAYVLTHPAVRYVRLTACVAELGVTPFVVVCAGRYPDAPRATMCEHGYFEGKTPEEAFARAAKHLSEIDRVLAAAKEGRDAPERPPQERDQEPKP